MSSKNLLPAGAGARSQRNTEMLLNKYLADPWFQAAGSLTEDLNGFKSSFQRNKSAGSSSVIQAVPLQEDSALQQDVTWMLCL